MAFTRRNKGAPFDIVYNRAWNAATTGDLPTGAPAAHGDVCLVAADGLWRAFMDDGTWQKFAAGATVTALNSQAHVSGTQSLAHNTLQAVAFATNDFDNGGIHSASVNNTRFTVPVGGGGVWLFIGTLYFTVPDNPEPGTYQWGTRKNGAGSTLVLQELPLSPASEATICGSVMYTLVAGDYIEFIAYQFTSAPVVITIQTGFTVGSAVKVG